MAEPWHNPTPPESGCIKGPQADQGPPLGWKYQVAQIDQQWWVNKVGTCGVASAQLYWGRMAALLLRLLYYAFPEVDWGFVFVDDFCWILRSTNCNSLTPAVLAFLVALGVPLSWKKTVLSEINIWLELSKWPEKNMSLAWHS